MPASLLARRPWDQCPCSPGSWAQKVQGKRQDLGREIGHKKIPFQLGGQQANSIKNKPENLHPLYLPLPGHLCPGSGPIIVPTRLMFGLLATPALRLHRVPQNAWLLGNPCSRAGRKRARRPGWVSGDPSWVLAFLGLGASVIK